MKTIFGILSLLAISNQGMAGQNASKPYYVGGGKVKFEDLRKSTVIKLSPFHFFDRSIQLNSEFFNAKYKTSIQIGFTGTYREDKEVIDKGAAGEIQIRHYPRTFRADSSNWIRNGASGFYVGASVSGGVNTYSSISQNFYYDSNGNYQYASSVNTAKSQWVTPSVLLGFQFIVWESMYLDFYVGGGIKLNDVKNTSSNPAVNPENQLNNANIFSRYYKGVLPKLGFTLGIGI